MIHHARSRNFALVAAIGLAVILAAGPLTAQQPQGKPAPAAEGQKPAGPEPGRQPVPPPAERPLSITHHSITLNGKPLAYTATAGSMIVAKSDETPGARIYFTAYTRDGAGAPSDRPLTFVFNGGPGSSSTWLHLGGLGPKRVRMDDNGVPTAPPYELEESRNTILDLTDMVFIDPVMTGFSRPLPGQDKAQFTGVGEDLASVGEFIREYVSRFGRWNSPKFILGESYGTTRAAGLSGYLQGQSIGMYLNGIILVSSVLDFSTLNFMPGSAVSYVVYLPHYTATAWYHKKLAPALQNRPLKDVLAEAEKFAAGEYASALFMGNRLSPEEADGIAAKLAYYTGLDKAYVKSANLRVNNGRFDKELRRSEMLTVGRLDSRFTGRDSDAAGERTDGDPASKVMGGAFSTLINDYMRRELGVNEELPYAIYGSVMPWNFLSAPETTTGFGMPKRSGGFGTTNVNVAVTLEQALNENPHLQVFVANGFYDGATPYFGTQFTFSQIGLNGEFKTRVHMGYYESGHMIYIHRPSLEKLKADLAGFYKLATAK